jgi:hypothetical protein
MKPSSQMPFAIGMATVCAAVLVACASHQSLPVKHPMEVQGMPTCSECHPDDWRAELDHRPGYFRKHKFYASRRKQACELCHAGAFCADCHTNKEELKPSDKFKDEPWRNGPHQGDYLNQHRIDGKINPASCFPCHGRKNNEQCRTCHR